MKLSTFKILFCTAILIPSAANATTSLESHGGKKIDQNAINDILMRDQFNKTPANLNKEAIFIADKLVTHEALYLDDVLKSEDARAVDLDAYKSRLFQKKKPAYNSYRKDTNSSRNNSWEEIDMYNSFY